jgi:hypothetical protein
MTPDDVAKMAGNGPFNSEWMKGSEPKVAYRKTAKANDSEGMMVGGLDQSNRARPGHWQS